LENNRKIVIIDDEAHIRRVIELKLKNQGYQVETATNGEDGFEMIKDKKPDVVITDIMMPQLDGKTLTKKISGFKEEWPFLTIVMTCRISPNESGWIEKMKDTLFIEKPFSPSRLVEYIDKYFETRKK
jgi:DNA-binding NtrC family response regulator